MFCDCCACVCVLMMMMICYLERSLVVFICEWITMMNNHHTVEIIWSLGWSTDNVMIVQFCAWYCYWATSDSHSVGELTQSFLGFFLWLMFLSMWPWKQPECNVCIDTWIGIECCDALCYMVWQNKRVLCEKKTKQNKTKRLQGKKTNTKAKGEKLQGKKSKKDIFQCEILFIQKICKTLYKRDSITTHIEDNT